jgi:hypothetical protein
MSSTERSDPITCLVANRNNLNLLAVLSLAVL